MLAHFLVEELVEVVLEVDLAVVRVGDLVEVGLQVDLVGVHLEADLADHVHHLVDLVAEDLELIHLVVREVKAVLVVDFNVMDLQVGHVRQGVVHDQVDHLEGLDRVGLNLHDVELKL